MKFQYLFFAQINVHLWNDSNSKKLQKTMK